MSKEIINFSVYSINTYLSDIIDSFISAFLFLKPKFICLINPVNGVKDIDAFIEQNYTEIEKFINGEILMINIETNSLSDLVIAFKMIPLPTISLFQKDLAKDIISFLIPKVLNS